MNGKNKNNRTETTVSSTHEDSEEVINQTAVIEFACPMCKMMVEPENELEIQKEGTCQRSCVPIGFKVSKNDKKMNIDKTKDSTNLEKDVHNITFRWGRQATPSDNGDNEARNATREMMNSQYIKSDFNATSNA